MVLQLLVEGHQPSHAREHSLPNLVHKEQAKTSPPNGSRLLAPLTGTSNCK